MTIADLFHRVLFLFFQAVGAAIVMASGAVITRLVRVLLSEIPGWEHVDQLLNICTMVVTGGFAAAIIGLASWQFLEDAWVAYQINKLRNKELRRAAEFERENAK